MRSDGLTVDSTGVKVGPSDIVWRLGTFLMDSYVNNERVIVVSRDDGDAFPSSRWEGELSNLGLTEKDRLSDACSLVVCSEDFGLKGFCRVSWKNCSFSCSCCFCPSSHMPVDTIMEADLVSDLASGYSTGCCTKRPGSVRPPALAASGRTYSRIISCSFLHCLIV